MHLIFLQSNTIPKKHLGHKKCKYEPSPKSLIHFLSCGGILSSWRLPCSTTGRSIGFLQVDDPPDVFADFLAGLRFQLFRFSRVFLAVFCPWPKFQIQSQQTLVGNPGNPPQHLKKRLSCWRSIFQETPKLF